MAQTRCGAILAASRRLGIPSAEYQERLQAGHKWCYRCRRWLVRSAFGVDRSRGDGLASSCEGCRRTGGRSGPGRAERKRRKAAGLFWCRDCKAWLPLRLERNPGTCQDHYRERLRQRYGSDPAYRERRIALAVAHKRKIAPVPPEARAPLLEAFGGACAYCGGPPGTWDHVVPVSRGGQTEPWNVVPCCRSCNSRKRNKLPDAWLATVRADRAQRVLDRLTLENAP